MQADTLGDHRRPAAQPKAIAFSPPWLARRTSSNPENTPVPYFPCLKNKTLKIHPSLIFGSVSVLRRFASPTPRHGWNAESAIARRRIHPSLPEREALYDCRGATA